MLTNNTKISWKSNQIGRLISMISYLIECAEINYFTIEVDAEDENQARDLAKENINKFEVIDEWVSEWDINDIKELDEDGCAI